MKDLSVFVVVLVNGILEVIYLILLIKLDNVGVYVLIIEMSVMIFSVFGINKRFIFDVSVVKLDFIILFWIFKFNNKFLDFVSGFDVCFVVFLLMGMLLIIILLFKWVIWVNILLMLLLKLVI